MVKYMVGRLLHMLRETIGCAIEVLNNQFAPMERTSDSESRNHERESADTIVETLVHVESTTQLFAVLLTTQIRRGCMKKSRWPAVRALIGVGYCKPSTSRWKTIMVVMQANARMMEGRF